MSQGFFLNFVLGFVRNVKIFLVFVGIVIEEVGQPIRRTSRPIRLRHFPHARTKLLASKIYIGLINIDFFHIFMQIFFEISRDTTFTTVNLPIGTVS